jgi:hypothetical protein
MVEVARKHCGKYRYGYAQRDEGVSSTTTTRFLVGLADE